MMMRRIGYTAITFGFLQLIGDGNKLCLCIELDRLT